MTKVHLENKVNCSDLSSDEIDYQVKNLIFNKFKYIVLTNAYGKRGLLQGLKGDIKIEVIGDVDSEFANDIDGPKIIVNGNIGDNSGCRLKNGKFTVFGSCGKCFGNDVKSGEFYIFENCGNNSFSNLDSSSKAVLGGQNSGCFAADNSGIIVLLNLKGGSIFLEEDFLRNESSGIVYIRGEKEKIKKENYKLLIENTIEEDEDLYLPLISEFARLFNYSLSEIKSKPFNQVFLK